MNKNNNTNNFFINTTSTPDYFKSKTSHFGSLSNQRQVFLIPF